jgi:hypothetical protein
MNTRRLLLLTPVAFCLICISVAGCWQGQPRIESRDLAGVWRVDPDLLKSDEYSLDSLRGMTLALNENGDFALTNIPRGLFFNKDSQRASHLGTWSIRWDNYNYLELTVTNLHLSGSSHYGARIDSRHMKRVIRADQGRGFIYLTKSTSE